MRAKSQGCKMQAKLLALAVCLPLTKVPNRAGSPYWAAGQQKPSHRSRKAVLCGGGRAEQFEDLQPDLHPKIPADGVTSAASLRSIMCVLRSVVGLYLQDRARNAEGCINFLVLPASAKEMSALILQKWKEWGVVMSKFFSSLCWSSGLQL